MESTAADSNDDVNAEIKQKTVRPAIHAAQAATSFYLYATNAKQTKHNYRKDDWPFSQV